MDRNQCYKSRLSKIHSPPGRVKFISHKKCSSTPVICNARIVPIAEPCSSHICTAIPQRPPSTTRPRQTACALSCSIRGCADVISTLRDRLGAGVRRLSRGARFTRFAPRERLERARGTGKAGVRLAEEARVALARRAVSGLMRVAFARQRCLARPARPDRLPRGARQAHLLRVKASVHAGGESADVRGGEEGVYSVEACDVGTKCSLVGPIAFANKCACKRPVSSRRLQGKV